MAGMPKLTLPREQMLAANENDAESRSQAAARPQMQSEKNAERPAKKSKLPGSTIVRSQSPDVERTTEKDSLFEPAAKVDNKTASIEEFWMRGSELEPESSVVQPDESRRSSIQAPVPRRRDGRANADVRQRQDESSSRTDSFFDDFPVQ